MAFFRRKSSVKDDIKRDEEIQSLLDDALEPIDHGDKIPEPPSRGKIDFDKTDGLDNYQNSLYEELLKSAKLPTLSEEELIQVEKDTTLQQSQITQETVTQMEVDFSELKGETDPNDTSSLDIPDPEEDTTEALSDDDIKEDLVSDYQPPSLEDKIDAQLNRSVNSSVANPGEIRVDVARISADIQSGEELYRRAQIRIESLTEFVERAEIDTAILKKLEPENRNLKRVNQKLTDEIDKKGRQISVLEADLEDHRKRLAAREESAEQAQDRLARASKALQDYELALKSAQQTSEQNYVKLERNETALDIERRENKLLQDKIKALSKALDNKNIKLLESEKTSDSLKEDYAVLKTQTIRLQDNNEGFKNALDEATKQNNFMKGKLVSLHEDIKNYKSQSEFNLTAKEERIHKLEGQISELARQVEIKDEILCNTARDVSELRKARSAYNKERERLEQHVDTLTEQLSQAQSKLLRVGKSKTGLDKTYEEVSRVSGKANPNRSLDTHENLPQAEENERLQTPQMAKTVSETEIANRILNYKRSMEPGSS